MFEYLGVQKYGSALSLCVFPFLPGDAVKIAAAALLVPRLKRVIKL